MIDTVIFDLDGLLIDSEPIFFKIDNEILKEFNKSFDLKTYTDIYCGRTVEKNMQELIANYKLPITVEEAINKLHYLLNKYGDNEVKLKSGAKELLIYLKENNYKIALASSSEKDRAIKILKNNGVEEYFDEFACAGDVRNGKPAPDIFLSACDKCNSKPINCLVLEDSNSGIMAGHKAKMKVICVPDLKRPDEEHKILCTKILDNLKEVIDYLKEENK